MTLTEFLLARIAEDQRRAAPQHEERKPGGQPVPSHVVTKTWRPAEGRGLVIDEAVPWTVQFGRNKPQQMTADEYKTMLATVFDAHYELVTEVRDPKLLAECEAKRRILDVALELDGREEVGNGAVLDLLDALALPYADHPDYKQEWRP